jgi:hypothetical protein
VREPVIIKYAHGHTCPEDHILLERIASFREANYCSIQDGRPKHDFIEPTETQQFDHPLRLKLVTYDTESGLP